MDKWKLRSLRKLTVTAQIRKAAKENAIRKKRWRNHYGACDPAKDRPYALFLRSSIEDGILQVALFFPSYVLAGAKDPSYVVYVDRAARAFLTYGTERQNWLTGKRSTVWKPGGVFTTEDSGYGSTIGSITKTERSAGRRRNRSVTTAISIMIPDTAHRAWSTERPPCYG